MPRELQRCFFVFVLSFLLSSCSEPSQPEANQVTQLRGKIPLDLCTSYIPATGTWGLTGVSSSEDVEGNCPEGSAYFSARNKAGPLRPGENIGLLGNCCKLPDGILTSKHSYATLSCPVNTVATGFRGREVAGEITAPGNKNHPKFWGNIRTQEMRCTEIDTTRYRLSVPTKGINIGWYKHFRTYFDKRSTRSKLPPVLRYGLGRIAKSGWSPVFCVGYPWGSLLTSKSSKYCEGFGFKQLQFKGNPGDPTAGTPVLDLTYCLAVENPLSKDARCLK